MEQYFYENEKRLAAFALIENITGIRVSFEGSGDSGSIDNIDVNTANGGVFDLSKRLKVYQRPANRFNPQTKEWENPPAEEALIPFDDFITEHVYDQLDSAGVDWYNNDGGMGDWEWSPQTGVCFNVDVRTTHTETAHWEERTLGYPEEEPAV